MRQVMPWTMICLFLDETLQYQYKGHLVCMNMIIFMPPLQKILCPLKFWPGYTPVQRQWRHQGGARGGNCPL